jgi:hypothetical protein
MDLKVTDEERERAAQLVQQGALAMAVLLNRLGERVLALEREIRTEDQPAP